MKHTIIAFLGFLMLSGCGKDQKADIQPMYFSPSMFMNMSCEDLFGFAYNADLEVNRIKEELQDVYDPTLFRIPILGWGYAPSAEARKHYYDGLEDRKQEEKNARELISQRMGQAIAAREAYERKDCHPVQTGVVEQGS
ncbi:MAG: hypothetical protein OXF09_06140 [Hyphomicrobiales bacterium]|nr:hypothetical protein [Hyphomicrobiales bacterium]